MRPIQDDERPRLLADENIREGIVEGLRRHYPAIDMITVQEAQIRGMKDPELLRFAMKVDRILLTHDVNTIPNDFWQLVAQLRLEETSPGVWTVEHATPIGEAIQAIAEYWGASRHEEYRNIITWVA